METAKMCRGLVMLSVMVAVAVLCSHRLAMAEEVAEQFDSELAQLQEVAETREAIDSKSSSNQQAATCCAKDKEKIKSCMFNTASIDQCCPTFKIMLGRNCDCYNYAKNLDNQALITLESYCDVTDPCNKAQFQVM
ncbi:PREDICTED: uncharacterized protein LOC109220469 isoform X3 [Nicotiana attenuata]|uniref:uncharacterized protein LOC109220469 isoform X3 n=1 Tax=Nicotiana attenuata TaxID=49451 RepID=UPI0009055AC7|nr:PREDICTED: uncharacterized protein LOC109220469 isoform X3 [Nicotiana attenuata]